MALHDLSDIRDKETAIGLLRRLMDELAPLFRREVELATVELTGALSKLVSGFVSVLSGGVVLFAGVLVLLASLVLALAEVMAPWLAALLVGAAVSLLGIILVLMGRQALNVSGLKPEQSIDSLRQDKDTLMRKKS